MGGADGVEARFLQLTNAALLGIGQGSCTKNAVVVVDAGTPQLDGLPVDAYPMRCIDAQGTDAEAGLFPVQFFLALQHLHGAGVEVGVLRAPQSRAVHAVPEGDGSAFAGLEQEVLPVGEHCRALPADGLLQGHPFCNGAGRLHLRRHIQ